MRGGCALYGSRLAGRRDLVDVLQSRRAFGQVANEREPLRIAFHDRSAGSYLRQFTSLLINNDAGANRGDRESAFRLAVVPHEGTPTPRGTLSRDD